MCAFLDFCVCMSSLKLCVCALKEKGSNVSFFNFSVRCVLYECHKRVSNKGIKGEKNSYQDSCLGVRRVRP